MHVLKDPRQVTSIALGPIFMLLLPVLLQSLGVEDNPALDQVLGGK